MVLCGYSSCVVKQLSVFQISKLDQERLWLGLPLAMVPVDTLPSEKTVLRAIYGIFDNNMKKYRENSETIGCLLLKDKQYQMWGGEGLLRDPQPLPTIPGDRDGCNLLF